MRPEEFVARDIKRLLRSMRAGRPPLQLGLLSRTLLHSALVGATAGVAGCVFFWGLENTQYLVLQLFAGYIPLRAAGEHIVGRHTETLFRPWLLVLLPAVGALIGGIVSARFAPETQGGGADAIIESFHQREGLVRRRVPTLKAVVSVLTLGFGGSGGREGPIMQIGGAIGSLIARALRVNARERRVLLVAGLAAGVAAVFRTPLGAALLAVEVLHRDDFESDALVPSVLASVVAYSVFISVFGEATLFAHAASYPFVPEHLPLYALMALVVCIAAVLFVHVLEGTRRVFAVLKLPAWCKPGIGGLALGLGIVPLLLLVSGMVGGEGRGLGILGGNYGAAQLAITGAPWLGGGWLAVELLLALGLVKILATSLTIGSGGSAGDFGPSLVIGALFGGAFGHAAQLLLGDPRIDPGAFALVGMATFYGGLAHCPLASLVMVCELTGSYELLVPLMLAEGVAFVALRHKMLYRTQVDNHRASPAHRSDLIFDVLKDVRVGTIVVKNRPYVSFHRRTPALEIVRQVGTTEWQDVFPVLGDDGKLVGLISSEVLRTLANSPDLTTFALADDMMGAPVAAHADEDLHVALEMLLRHGLRELVVTERDGTIVGILDEAEITRAYHDVTSVRPA